MRCGLRRLTDHRMMNNFNLSAALAVSNARTWVTRERKRAGVQSDSPLFSHCWKLNVNEQSVWRLPAAGYKSPLQALSLSHTGISFQNSTQQKNIQGIGHSKKSFTHCCVVPDLYGFLRFVEHRRCFAESPSCSVHPIKVDRSCLHPSCEFYSCKKLCRISQKPFMNRAVFSN